MNGVSIHAQLLLKRTSKATNKALQKHLKDEGKSQRNSSFELGTSLDKKMISLSSSSFAGVASLVVALASLPVNAFTNSANTNVRFPRHAESSDV